MPPATEPTFTSERLAAVRKRRELTITALSVLSGVSTKSLSDFENGKKSPAHGTVERLAAALDVPLDYFAKAPLEEVPAAAVSFRARTKMSAKNRDYALATSEHAVELRAWIDLHYRTPRVDVPTLHRFTGLDGAGEAAAVVRARWGLGESPLGNVVHLLEQRGVAVFSTGVGPRAVDAFSFWNGTRPFVMLSTSKSAERGRFDAAHELGHLVLHKEVESSGRDVEREADSFASAFLMPEADVRAHVRLNSPVNELLRQKRRWGVAAMALAYRLHDLGLLSDWIYHTTCVNLSRAGYRSGEPGGIERERSKVLSAVLADLWKTPRGFTGLREELAVGDADINSLIFDLAPVAIRGQGQRVTSDRPALSLVAGTGDSADA